MQLPDVSTELESVRTALEDVNLEESIVEGQQEFDNISQTIITTVDENLGSESTQFSAQLCTSMC